MPCWERSIVSPGKFMLTLYKACTSPEGAEIHSVLTSNMFALKFNAKVINAF